MLQGGDHGSGTRPRPCSDFEAIERYASYARLTGPTAFNISGYHNMGNQIK